jgi:CHAD domain-containing protein
VTNGEWSNSPGPLTIARRERPAVEFAAEILDQRAKKISGKVEDIDGLDVRQRHKLRIAVKKLRYACEFFAGLFDDRKETRERKRLTSILKTLQGSLGALNDIEVHKRLAVTIAHPRKRIRKQAEKALAMGFIAGQEQQQIASCIAFAEKTGEQLLDSAKFWKG